MAETARRLSKVLECRSSKGPGIPSLKCRLKLGCPEWYLNPGSFRGIEYAIKQFKQRTPGRPVLRFEEIMKERDLLVRLKHKRIVTMVGAFSEMGVQQMASVENPAPQQNQEQQQYENFEFKAVINVDDILKNLTPCEVENAVHHLIEARRDAVMIVVEKKHEEEQKNSSIVESVMTASNANSEKERVN
ncbi:unnamed protein product [Orchesella dallaii]|uniref:Uncharacterized protein n=1 Tax=Orchesella dallaii TaxID=48710 RepID=A0ABP1S8R4_9HEXA